MPAPATPIAAAAELIAPPGAHPRRRKAWNIALVCGGLLAALGGVTWALAPDSARKAAWDWICAHLH